MEKMYTIQEVADLFRVKKRTVYQWLFRKKIKTLANRKLIAQSEVDKIIGV